MTALFLLLLFALCKVGFLLYVGGGWTWADVPAVLWHGLPMDASTVGYLVALPLLLRMGSVWWPALPLRRVLTPYYVLVALLVSAAEVMDMALYPFWGFKLDATIFNYADSPADAVASVTRGFVVGHTLCWLLLAVAMAAGMCRLTPRHARPSAHRWLHTLGLTLCGGVLFVVIRGGVGKGTMNVGNAYYSGTALLNHAAVNPLFSLISSASKADRFGELYRMMPAAECAATFDALYPSQTDDVQDTLLTTTRPNVLLIIVEGMGARFFPDLGGLPDVTPSLQRWAERGVWWTHFYSTSFRTDRGVLSTLSGHVSYPVHSLMKMPAKCQRLPSIARTLRQHGYRTDFLYGGDLNFTNMRGYVLGSGYEQAVGDEGFSLEERHDGPWGAGDSIVLERLYQSIISRADTRRPWHTAVLTLSSHEPWEVPYQRLADERLNAFAYTDHHLGRLLDRLSQTPQWRDMLVVLLPDHGYAYDIDRQAEAFFRAPMLWVGGAVREPRRMDVVLSQSDVAATLLAQMHLPHDDFAWSRNVLSASYTYPFAYGTMNDVFFLRDSTGYTLFDNKALTPAIEEPSPSAARIERGKAILQTSYDRLSQMER